MYYGNIKYFTIEDGIGCRTALFVSGCRHHCKGCFQPQTWNFKFGKEFTKETENEIIESLKNPYVDGITILGGEPFEPENQPEIHDLLLNIKTICPNKTIWIYSGYTFEELTDSSKICHTEKTIPILNMTDILVDGEFIEKQKNIMLPFRGSSNQRVIDIKQSLSEKKVILSEFHEKHRL